MVLAKFVKRSVLFGTVSVAAAVTTAGAAFAGGFDVREQSVFFQGMSFAGAAAGGSSLSSMFWNPAAAGYVGEGITSESNYSAILPTADITAETIDLGGGPIPAGALGLDTTVDVGRDAIVPASYMAYRLSSQMVLAISMNSQYGLGTEPDNPDWVGQNLARSAKLFSVNAAPTLAYEIAPGIQVGAGIQLQYMDLKRFKSAAGAPGIGVPSATLEGDDFSVGYTLGVNFRPLPGTSIGLGFRSSIKHELEGNFSVGNVTIGPISADLELPEKVTLGIRQDLAPGIRGHATVEWTNWDRLDTIPVVGSPAVLEFQWEDGWYFALGGEYDYSEKLTLRAGVGYEISPIQEASQRLIQLPDADRVWISAGGSYAIGDLFGLLKDAKIDLAYSHIFVEESDFIRSPAAAPAPVLTGSVDASVDIVSIGLRSKW
jgi:long-chain fatty acid transport protein